MTQKMTIFSLQTKKHLLGWSVVTGVGFHLGFLWMTYRLNRKGFGFYDYYVDWPLKIHITDYPDQFFLRNFIANTIFWFLVSLILLSLIRYFKYRTNYK